MEAPGECGSWPDGGLEMMRIARMLCAVAAVLAVVHADAGPTNASPQKAITRLLNSRATGSVRGARQAAEEMAAEAKAGHLVQAYALAVVSRLPSPPPAARLDETTCKQYLDGCRDKLRLQADKKLKPNPMAMFLLSLECGDRDLLRRAAEGGNVQAMNAWGVCLVAHAAGETGTNDILKAYGYFKSAADRDDANGLYNLGMCQLRGLGTPQDDRAAFDSFRRAAEKGHPEAMNCLGLFYREGRVVEKDLERSVEWFEKSVDHGNAFGQFCLARALLKGEGAAKDEARAAELTAKAMDGEGLEAFEANGLALWRPCGVKDGLAEDIRHCWAARMVPSVAVLLADAGPTNAVARLLNARASGSTRDFVQAAEDLSAELKAAKEEPFQAFCAYVLALASRMSPPPPAARFGEATRAKYLDGYHEALRRFVDETKNPLGMYLLSLENDDLDLLRRAAEGGNVQAMNAWGVHLVVHAAGETGTNDLSKACGCFRAAAEKDDANGLYNLGMCQLRGLGTPKNDLAAFDSCRRAAEKGHPEAMTGLGLLCREGRVVGRDVKASVAWFEKSASHGNAFGQFNLARALQTGTGAAKDEARAAALLEKAAAGEGLEAFEANGLAPWQGKGVKEGPAAAFRQFRADRMLPTITDMLAHVDQTNAIMRLLDSRASGSVRGFMQAAEDVATEANAAKEESIRSLYAYVLAIISRMPSPPPAARLDEATRAKYLNGCRETIKMLADKKNDPMALYLLSLESNDHDLLRRAADAGNVQAMNAWGTYLITRVAPAATDTNEVNRILGKAYGYFETAAEKGDANGCYNLGMCHLRGFGTPLDDKSAVKYFYRAAEKDHPEAINDLGLFFREGRVVEKNLEESVRRFEKSAGYDNAFGQYNLALALQSGEGVAQDEARAAELLFRAAEGDCVEAVDAYGLALLNGRGVTEDPEAAFDYFLRAAGQGYPPAMENLSTCYRLGKGVKADERRSLEWKIRSRAARGDRNAQAWLQQNAR